MCEVLDFIINDFNRQIKYCLTEEELKEYLVILNQKRSKLGLSVLSLEDLNDPDTDVEAEESSQASEGIDDGNFYLQNSNYSKVLVIVSVTDVYQVIHFCRFVKKVFDTVKNDDLPFENVYVPLFSDLLKFALKYVSEYD